mmetsp:Transcript_86340/g.268280  ORF Transcript_86340/g.268280 Transcript_86340/m.268280 type:complete len:243 (-) Transcript_86340:58-786(-)
MLIHAALGPLPRVGRSVLLKLTCTRCSRTSSPHPRVALPLWQIGLGAWRLGIVGPPCSWRLGMPWRPLRLGAGLLGWQGLAQRKCWWTSSQLWQWCACVLPSSTAGGSPGGLRGCCVLWALRPARASSSLMAAGSGMCEPRFMTIHMTVVQYMFFFDTQPTTLGKLAACALPVRGDAQKALLALQLASWSTSGPFASRPAAREGLADTASCGAAVGQWAFYRSSRSRGSPEAWPLRLLSLQR